jgi:predicted transcriptional regulator
MAYVFPKVGEIARRRRVMGISQNRLAAEAGISQSLLAKIESGNANPSYAAVNGLFEALDRHEAGDSKKASDVMARDVVVLKYNDSISKAARLAKEHRISQFPVEKNGVYIGSVRSLDLLDAKKNEEAATYIKNEFPTVGQETPLNAVIVLLSATGMPVIVLSKGKVAGIITADDLFYKKV